MRVLIVDDQEENLYLLEALLTGNGWDVVSATNGAEALAKLRAQAFDLVVADILMPVMDGYQLCREVKGDNELKDIPFVFYTATYTDERDEELALELGADKFIRKPAEPDEFLKSIRATVGRVTKGEIKAQKPALEKKKDVFELYSERLVKKLEYKMLALERAVTEGKRAEEALRESRERLLEAQRVARMGFMDWNLRTDQIYWSDEVYRLYGIEPIGSPQTIESTVARVHPDDLEDVQKRLEFALQGVRRYECQHRIVRRDGEVIWVHARADVERDESGEPVTLLGTVVDITERKLADAALRRNENRTGLLKEVAIAANEAQGADEALLVALERVCDFTKWPVGHVYVPAHDGSGDLVSTKLWHFDAPERFGVFKEVTERTRFAPGIGLPGRVLATGQPAWIVDVTKDPNFPRAKLAKNIGVRGGFGFPVLLEKQVIAVLEFFSADAEIPDETLLEVMAQIGIQLGTVMDRKRAQEALQQAHDELEMKVRDRTAELKQSEERLREAQKMALLGYWERDLKTGRLWWSPEEFDIQGVTGGEPPTMEEFYSHVHEEDRDRIRKVTEQFLKGVNEAEFEYRIHHPERGVRIIAGAARAETDAQGAVVKLLGIEQDVTVRREAEQALQQARDEAELANRAKSTFLANMSHEIRTPMNAVLGFSQLLQRSATLAPADRDHVTHILRSGEHLLGLINDVLEMATIEASRMRLQPSSFDLYGMLDDLEAMFLLQAKEKGLQFEIERFDDVPQYVTLDEGKLRQILINVLGNAEKFTVEGGVAMRVGAQDADGDVSRLIVEVQDTGPGIAPEELSKVFEAFVQTASGTAAHQGTGLGMSLSREYARLMRGDLTVTSEVGQGSVFRLEIAFEHAELADAVMPVETRRVVRVRGAEGLRVLVVDDKADNRTFMTTLLGDAGIVCREATNGEEAIAEWEAWKPTVILMDMRMPVLDGYAATRRIKATERGKTTKIIAVTASAFDQNAEKILDAGADEFLWKPFKALELFEKLAQVAGVEYEYVDETGAPEEEVELTGEALVNLPAQLISAMREATVAADAEQLSKLIDEVEATDERLAIQLRSLVERYEYDRLAQLL